MIGFLGPIKLIAQYIPNMSIKHMRVLTRHVLAVLLSLAATTLAVSWLSGILLATSSGFEMVSVTVSRVSRLELVLGFSLWLFLYYFIVKLFGGLRIRTPVVLALELSVVAALLFSLVQYNLIDRMAFWAIFSGVIFASIGLYGSGQVDKGKAGSLKGSRNETQK